MKYAGIINCSGIRRRDSALWIGAGCVRLGFWFRQSKYAPWASIHGRRGMLRLHVRLWRFDLSVSCREALRRAGVRESSPAQPLTTGPADIAEAAVNSRAWSLPPKTVSDSTPCGKPDFGASRLRGKVTAQEKHELWRWDVDQGNS